MKENLQITINQKDAERKASLESQRVDMQGVIDTSDAARDEYLQLYTKESKMRKVIHNKLIEIQGNIRVICRVRPVLDVERKNAGDGVDVTSFGGANEDEISIQRDVHSKQKFEFDRVFQPNCQQTEVFEAIQPLCVSVLDGFNVCIFACKSTLKVIGIEIGI